MLGANFVTHTQNTLTRWKETVNKVNNNNS